MVQEIIFTDQGRLIEALAGVIADAMNKGIAARGGAMFVAAGGTSPRMLYPLLSQQQIAWSQVTILPSDDRWIASDQDASSEALIRRTLIRDNAITARFWPLTNDQPSPELGEAAINLGLKSLNWPSDYTLLGMGVDGHIAGLVPGSLELASALASDNPKFACALNVDPGQRPRSPADRRMTLTLSALLQARRIGVLILGEQKLEAYRRNIGDASTMTPIRALVSQDKVPVDIYWTANF